MPDDLTADAARLGAPDVVLLRRRPAAAPRDGTTAWGARVPPGLASAWWGTLIDIKDIGAAAERIAPHVLRTPTVPSPGLSALLGVPVTLKLELLQRTGSFKARGAFGEAPAR